MAKLNGIVGMFNYGRIGTILNEKRKEYDDKTLETLQYLGEEFVNKARQFGSFTDRTGNLRSSIGYIILKDGKRVDSNFEASNNGTDKVKGLKRALEYADEVAALYGTGFVLIGVAGMNYAAAVEAKGYEVLTTFAPDENDVKEIFDEIIF